MQDVSYFVVIGIYCLLFFPTITIFILKIKHPIIQKRQPFLVLWSMVISFFYLVLSCLGEDFYVDDISASCGLDAWVAFIVVPGWLLPYVLRSWILFFNFSQQQVHLATFSGATTTNTSFFSRFKWTTSWMFIYGIYFSVLLMCLLISWGIRPGTPLEDIQLQDPTCSVNDTLFEILLGEGIGVLALILISAVLVWQVRDTFHFRDELAMTGVAGIPIVIIWGVHAGVPSILPRIVSPNIWLFMAIAMTLTFSMIYPVILTTSWKWPLLSRISRMKAERLRRSTHPNNSDLELSVARGLPTLQECLQDPILLDSLKRYMAEGWVLENVLFLEEARKFEHNETMTPEEQLVYAKRLEQQYLIEGAPMEINLDQQVTSAIRKAIADGSVQKNLFAEAAAVVFEDIRLNHYTWWLESARFAAIVDSSEWAKNAVTNNKGSVKKHGKWDAKNSVDTNSSDVELVTQE